MWNMQRTLLALSLINLGLLAGLLSYNRTVAAPVTEPVLRAELIELVDKAGTVRSRLIRPAPFACSSAPAPTDQDCSSPMT